MTENLNIYFVQFHICTAKFPTFFISKFLNKFVSINLLINSYTTESKDNIRNHLCNIKQLIP
jgi:hypothetical protein